jgi:hypothetical protein
MKELQRQLLIFSQNYGFSTYLPLGIKIGMKHDGTFPQHVIKWGITVPNEMIHTLLLILKNQM